MQRSTVLPAFMLSPAHPPHPLDLWQVWGLGTFLNSCRWPSGLSLFLNLLRKFGLIPAAQTIAQTAGLSEREDQRSKLRSEKLKINFQCTVNLGFLARFS